MKRPRTHRTLARWLRGLCDLAAERGSDHTLRELHSFLTHIAANYVRFRMQAIECRHRGRHDMAELLEDKAKQLFEGCD